MPRPTSILQCLTPIELREFLPAPLDTELSQFSNVLLALDPEPLDPAAWASRLDGINPEVLLACWRTPPLPAVLPPALRYVCYLAGSIKHLVTRDHLAAGLLVTNWGNSISRTVAEGALLHILSGLRGSTRWTIEMHLNGAWKQRTSTTASLFGRRVGIRGFGRVAHELIALLQPFGCDIGVLAPDITPAAAASLGIRRVDSLDALMADHEVVVELAPLIAGTRRSIRREHLALLRPGSVFVNVGRGATVDEEALLETARAGQIFVGLDVFSEEPLPASSGFRGLLNVSLSPHLAGPTTDRRIDAGRHALANLAAYTTGAPLQGQITAEAYDQST